MSIKVINPTTGKKVKTYKALTEKQVLARIKKANKVQQEWQQTTFKQRAKLMHKAAKVLEKNKRQYAEVMTIEMGKTFQSAISEVEKCAWVCRYYANNAANFLADEIIETDASKR